MKLFSRFFCASVLIRLIPALILFVSFALPAQAESPASDLKPVTVQINWNHQFQFAGIYAAIKQGFYQNADLDVRVKPWRPGVHVAEEVTSGRADFGVGYGSLVVDYAKGATISLVMASFQFSPMVLLAHEPFRDLSELGGKTVMHYGNIQVAGLLNKARHQAEKPITEVSSSGNLRDFMDRKVDLYAAFNTNEPYRLRKAGVPFYILDPKTYGVQSYGELLITSSKMASFQPEQVEAFRQATIAGWRYALEHPEEVVDFIVRNYPVVKTRDAMLAEAKATAVYVETGEVPIGHVDETKLMATAAGAKELGLISQQAFEQLDISRFIFKSEQHFFTREELDYLEANPVIKLANDIDWEPFEFIDRNGRYKGLAADYFHLFEEKLGVKFVPVQDQGWIEVVEGAQAGQLDIFSCAVATPERKTYMRFTDSYLSFPMVVVSGEKVNFIQNPGQLNGKKVSVVRGYWSHENMLNRYPGVELVLVDSVKEGLDAVIENRAMAYVGNLAAVNHAIRKYGLEGVRVVGQFKERFELAVGVRKDDPVLFSIMQKALDSVSEAERQAIFDRWVKLEVVNKMDQRQLLQIAVPGLLVIIGLLSLAGFFNYQKRQQKRYIKQIHELSYATEIDLSTKRILWSSRSFSKLSGYSVEELKGMDYRKLASDSLSERKQKAMLKKLYKGRSWKGEVEGKTKSGRSYWVDLTLTPKKNLFGKVKTVLATRVNVTDKKRIEELSVTDPLTGLYNRRYFNEVMERELKRVQRKQVPLAVAMIDIDYFKKVNDIYGHPHGDRVLKRVASVIRAAFNRASDYVFRIGGEEFMILVYFDDADEFERHLKALCHEVQSLKMEHSGSPLEVVTISIGGIYLSAGESIGSERVMHLVDKMLYQSKSEGRNQVQVLKDLDAFV